MKAASMIFLAVLALAVVDLSPTPIAAQQSEPYIVAGPTIVSTPSVDSDGDGIPDTYGPSEVIRIEVRFSEQVCGDGDTYMTLMLQTGDGVATVRRADYDECVGPIVFFEYKVTSDDLDGDGLSIAANSIDLEYPSGVFQFPVHPPVPSDPNHKVNGSIGYATPPALDGPPGIYSVPRIGDTFIFDEVIEIVAHWTEDVVVDVSGGPPTIGLEVGSEIRLARFRPAWLCPDERPCMVFTYTVQAGDVDDDGLLQVPTGSLSVPSGSSIRDVAGNHADLFWDVTEELEGFKIRGFLHPTVTPTATATPMPARLMTPIFVPSTPGRNCWIVESDDRFDHVPGATVYATPPPTCTPTPSPTATPTHTPTTAPTYTPTITPTHTPTPTPTSTPTPTPTFTPTPTPTIHTPTPISVGPSIALNVNKDEITSEEDVIASLSWDNSLVNAQTYVLEITMKIPAGLSVYAAQGALSSTTGGYTGQFTIRPGEKRSLEIQAQVTDEGIKEIQMTGRYYPQMNPNDWKDINLARSINVVESAPPPASPPVPPTPTPTQTPSPTPVPPTPIGPCGGPCNRPCPSPTNPASGAVELAIGGLLLSAMWIRSRRRRNRNE